MHQATLMSVTVSGQGPSSSSTNRVFTRSPSDTSQGGEQSRSFASHLLTPFCLVFERVRTFVRPPLLVIPRRHSSIKCLDILFCSEPWKLGNCQAQRLEINRKRSMAATSNKQTVRNHRSIVMKFCFFFATRGISARL